MALEQITFNIGAFNDSDAGGDNYFTNTVFEVKNQSDNTFATIYADSSGATQIPQNGIDNVSNLRGECNFYIDGGDFYIEVNSQQKNFSTGSFKADFANIDEVKAYSKISKLVGRRITTIEYHAGTGYGGASYTVVESGSVSANGIDIIQSTSNPSYSFKIIDEHPIRLSTFGCVDGELSTSAIQRAIDKAGNIDVDGDYTYNSNITVSNEKLTIIGQGILRGYSGDYGIVLGDEVKQLILKDFGFYDGSLIQTSGGVTSNIDFLRVNNVRFKNSQAGMHLLGSVADGVFSGNSFDSLHRTISNSSCQAIRIGNNSRESALKTKKVIVDDNTFDGIYSDFSKETHAVHIYGIEVTCTSNVAEGVDHAGGVACETYYFKADTVTFTGNTAKNQGVSNDGCVTFKGGPSADVSQVTGQNITCTGNTIVNEDETKNIIGIACTDENAQITGNTLKNCTFKAFGADASNITFQSNSLDITADGFSPLWFEIENADNVKILSNTVRIGIKNFTANTVSLSRVRTTGNIVNKPKIKNNEVEVYSESITTANNTISSLQLWAEDYDIQGAEVFGNSLYFDLPNVSSSSKPNLLYFSGVNNIECKIKRNETNVEDIYYDDNSFSNRDVYFSDNTVNNIYITTGNKSFNQKVSDLAILNPDATADRVVNLPNARVGITVEVICASQSYSLVCNTGSSQYTDGTTSKVLSSGDSFKLRCYNSGYWQIINKSVSA